jgi:REP element-mobilizing transposase RayT
MILASHGIFTLYGFWLPNEERGSWSDFVRSWELLISYGNATKTDTRRSVAGESYDVQKRSAARDILKYPSVELSGVQARSVARGFAKAIEEGKYQLPACSILPRHVHIVSLRHERPIERIIGHLKARATQQLRAEGLDPFEEFQDDSARTPSVWTHRAWKVFLDSRKDIVRAIDYVNGNPVKRGNLYSSGRF